MKKILLISLMASILLLSMSPSAILAKSDGSGQVNATGIEMVKKVTLKGPASKGGKPSPFAATGTLGTPSNGNKYAIVIGISDYPGTASDLSYCDEDALEIYDVLITKYGYAQSNIVSLIDTAATRTSIFDAVNEIKSRVAALGEASSGAEVVFFFSGHGAKGKANDYDTNNVDQSIVTYEGGQFSYIWDGELKSWFSDFKTSRIVFIFDSCLSGGMSVLKAPGRIVNMACTATGLSYEGASWGGGHGQFTYYFAEEGMSLAKADVRTKDDMVTVEEAFDYAKANCNSQTPTISDGFMNDLLP